MDNFMKQISANSENKEMLEVVSEHKDLNFLLWNRTKNEVYEASTVSTGFSIAGYDAKEIDKVCIINVKENSLIKFSPYN